MPWAFLGAMLLIALAELSLHATKWPNPIPYALGRDEYYAVAATIDRSGAPNVAIVGSSRARESISVPLLHARIHKGVGRELSVINFATGGGRSIDFEAIIHRLLRDKPIPRTIIVGLSERDFAGTGWQYDNAPLFWSLHDWRENFRARGAVVLDDLPTVLRTTAGQWCRLLGRREQIRLRLSQMIRGMQSHEPSSPVRGEPSPWHLSATHKKIDRKDPELRAKVQMYVQRDLIPAVYPDPDQVAALDRLAAECQRRHVRLLMYEMPISSALQRELPPGMADTYRQITQGICEKYAARFVRLRDIHFRGGYKDFREPSHMNGDGAVRFTEAFADHAVVPTLKRDDEQDRKAKRERRDKLKKKAAGHATSQPTTDAATTATSQHAPKGHAPSRPATRPAVRATSESTTRPSQPAKNKKAK